MGSELLLALVVSATMLVMVAGMFVVMAKTMKRVKPHEAIIVFGTREPRVVLEGAVVVMPILHSSTTIDMSSKTLRFERRGKEALAAKDERVEMDVVVTIHVNRTREDVLRVAQRFGAERSYDVKAITDLVGARMTSAIGQVVALHTFDEILKHRSEAEDKILELIGSDLDGFRIERLAIERAERPPPEHAGPFR